MEDTYIYIYTYAYGRCICICRKKLENWKWDIISLHIRARFSLYDELCVLGQVPFSLSALVFPTA